MRANLRKVGNSRGIIIPASLLASCELGDEVELSLVGKTLVIAAVKEPRANWFGNYQVNDDVDVLDELSVTENLDEWQW
jgi:antitoxin MazE